jgi:hypothetical protein
MLTHEGVTLIDFGVARAADQSTLTATGVAVGTPAFMAPEQARAERTLTPAVDVFSLGGVLAFAASAYAPFGEGSGPDVFYRIVHQEPDLSAVQAADPALGALVQACLAKDPADRPTAAELVTLASAETSTGPAVWPPATAQQIAVRRAFAARAQAAKPIPEPIPEPDGTELESEPLSEPEDLESRRDGGSAVFARPPMPVPMSRVGAGQAGANPLLGDGSSGPGGSDNSDALELVPGPAPDSTDGRTPRRRRKALTVLLPLVLVLGVTAGTLVALNETPWSGDDAAAGGNDHPVAGSASGATGTPTPRLTTSAGHTATPSTAPATSTSASSGSGGSTGSSQGSGGSSGGSATGGSTGSGGGSGSGSGGSSGGSGSTGGSGGTTKTTAPSAPATPSGLAIAVPYWFGTATMDVSWDSESNVTQFELQIENTGKDVTLSGSTTTYQITDIPAGTTECIKLRAINAAGDSAWASACQNTNG